MKKLKRIPTQQERLEATNVYAILQNYRTEHAPDIKVKDYVFNSSNFEIDFKKIEDNVVKLYNSILEVKEAVDGYIELLKSYVLGIEFPVYLDKNKFDDLKGNPYKPLITMLTISDILDTLEHETHVTIMGIEDGFELSEIRGLAEIYDLLRELKYYILGKYPDSTTRENLTIYCNVLMANFNQIFWKNANNDVAKMKFDKKRKKSLYHYVKNYTDYAMIDICEEEAK